MESRAELPKGTTMRDNFNYTDEHQSQISFPLGGIGSGCIGLAGNGHLCDWEIFNRPAKGRYNGFTHFAVKVEDETKVLDTRVLNGDLKVPYTGKLGTDDFYEGFGFGPQRETMAGMPHFESNTFHGTFPLAKLDFKDDRFPGRVSMEAFNPLIPHQEDASSIPGAFFSFELTNTEEKTLSFYLTGVLGNPYKGRTRSRFTQSNGLSLMQLDSLDTNDYILEDGDLCVATDAQDVSFQEYFFRGDYFDALEVYWKDLTAPGHLQNRTYEPADRSIRDNSVLSTRVSLAPGESKKIRFVITWNHPLNKNTWGRMPAGRTTPFTDEENSCLAKSWKNYYAALWKDSTSSATFALKNWDRLYNQTVAFRDALFSSTMPQPVLDAVSANISLLKSPTVWRLEDGTLYGWEGVGAVENSCEGSCTHVWGYAQALPFLFPSLSRSMREAEYRYNWEEDGSMTFRLMLPVGSPRWHFRPAVDGQFATVMKTFREWKISGDLSWLKSLWPRVKASLEFAWSADNVDLWDPDKTGTITGRQHHTLDSELYGPNSWLTGMYLGALKAGAEMARAMDDIDVADEYTGIFDKGCKALNTDLFNGEYFIQNINLTDRETLTPYVDNDDFNLISDGDSIYDVYYSDEHQELKYQIGEGVAIDQMLGQWHSDLYGLGEIFDKDKVFSALTSLFKYNFRETMRDHYNPCRIYCLNDESGLVICSWPETKEQPAIPIPYSQETMHGFEYAAADLMIRRGLIKEGLRVIQGIRDRYDGKRRNPWNEMECGSNYARSMSSYSLLLSYSGFEYDGRIGHLSFNPIVSGDSNYFWSYQSAWGTFSTRKEKVELRILGGELIIKTLGLPQELEITDVKKNQDPIPFSIEESNIVLDRQVSLLTDDVLIVLK